MSGHHRKIEKIRSPSPSLLLSLLLTLQGLRKYLQLHILVSKQIIIRQRDVGSIGVICFRLKQVQVASIPRAICRDGREIRL